LLEINGDSGRWIFPTSHGHVVGSHKVHRGKAGEYGQLVGLFHGQFAALTAGLVRVGEFAAIPFMGARLAALHARGGQGTTPFRGQGRHRYSDGDDKTGQHDHQFTLREREGAVNAACRFDWTAYPMRLPILTVGAG